jgi:Ca-activated chloride channel family protein
MEWARPEYLYLILPLAAGWLLLSLLSRRRRLRAADAFVARAMWPRILPADSLLRFCLKLLCREAALVVGLMALAGPRFGTQYEEVIPRGSDLYILIDVSRSMLAEDVLPSRLGRAKADVASLVNRLQGERVGLIAFAGQAVVKCPLTVDYDSFRRSLDELDTGSAPRGGTAIGDAIRKALEVFQAKAERDQAILLITDGDDQESYPREAAAVAAERQVTIFTVGLGDADQGARVPKAGTALGFVEYQGQQVWSKLGSSLLEDIALKTSGVYVPVGTKSYDLGELYADHLKGRRGRDDETQKRLRRSEQFQMFLALAIAALLMDLLIGSYATRGSAPASPESDASKQTRTKPAGKNKIATQDVLTVLLYFTARLFRVGVDATAISRSRLPGGTSFASLGFGRTCGRISKWLPRVPIAWAGCEVPPGRRNLPKCVQALIEVIGAITLAVLGTGVARADNPSGAVREGIDFYAQAEFEKARDKFASARQEFDKESAAKAAIAAFDEACAAHRKGDVSQARDAYLQSGLAHDKKLAAAAHFNLGTLSAEEARRLAGEHPEEVPAEKRQEILDQLAAAVASFRHSLELQRDNPRARRDIELVRQWIRYYSEKWRERDLQKRREETNLVKFLEFLIETQRGLKETVAALPRNARADAFAELKRLQDELHDEIEPLNDKIKTDLTPAAPSGNRQPAVDPQELAQGIALLQSWADTAGEKMGVAAQRLAERHPSPATEQQQLAIDELERIWEAVIPFAPLLARDLADQTKIVRELEPSAGEKAKSDEVATIESNAEDITRQSEAQEQTRRRTQLLKLKAELELDRLEKSPPAAKESPQDPTAGSAGQPRPVDPEQIKAGYQKAIELAPQAVEKMEDTLRSLKQHDGQSAYQTAEEARKILEEIQKAQPRQEQPPPENQQDQKKDEQRDKQQDKQDQQDQQDEKQKQEDEKQNSEQKKNEKKDEQKKQDDQSGNQDKSEKQKQPQMSRDQVEETLRKVRERQQEKRDRDKKLKARVIGKVPVEKDW